MGFIVAILALGLLIAVHEFGHFLAAKLLRTKAEVFSIGFGPKILSKKLGETDFILSAIPFGGYVKLNDDEFKKQPYLKKVTIILAGPLLNIILCFFIFFFMMITAFPSVPPEIGQVLRNSPAEQAGIEQGDIIMKINGRTISDWEDIVKVAKKGKPITLLIKRQDRVFKIKLTPRYFPEYGRHLIGISPVQKIVYRRFPVHKACLKAAGKTLQGVLLVIGGIKNLVAGKISPKEVAGPAGIVHILAKNVRHGISSFLILIAIISVNLGVVNLLPIPVMDGGQILIVSADEISKKWYGTPLPDSWKEALQLLGLGVVIVIFIFVSLNDIMRIVKK